MNKNLTYLPVDKLHPHPQNPRKELGDLTELADSIKSNGVFQNLTVITGHYQPDGSWVDTDYTVIIGHRRRAASELAGLTELPCAIVEMSKQDQLSTMLLENMQRSDLTVYEQAQGFQLMIELGDTPEGIAEKTGFSKKTVNRRLEMARLNPVKLKEVSARQISLADFDKLAQLDSIEERNACLSYIGTSNFNQALDRKIQQQEVSKKLPAIKDLLKTNKALRIKGSGTWNGNFKEIGKEYRVADWDKVEVPTPSRGRLHYCLEEDYGRLRFYEENKKKVVKRPQAEIDREKAMAEANEKCSALSEEAYRLRKNFVESLVLNSKNKEDMFIGALDGCFLSVVLYSYGGSDPLYKMAGVENKYTDDSRLALYKALHARGSELIPRLIYAAFGDENREKYHTEYKLQFPRHKKSFRLDMIYTWLVSIGYQMSDDERMLQDGSHPLLKLGE